MRNTLFLFLFVVTTAAYGQSEGGAWDGGGIGGLWTQVGDDIDYVTGRVAIGQSDFTVANTAEDDLIVGGSSNRGITLYSSTNAVVTYAFADPENSEAAWIRYNHTGDAFSIRSNGRAVFEVDANHDIIINNTGNDDNFRIEASGNDSAFVIDGTDGDIYMEGLGSSAGGGTHLQRLGTNEIVEDSSSELFKENIRDMNIRGDVLNLRPRQYESGGQSSVHGIKGFGLIAEEVAKIIPEAVTYRKGKPYSIDYGKIAVLLIPVLIDQQKQIDELKERIN